jgi:hypothetical protein
MADAVQSAVRQLAQSRRRRDDLAIGVASLIGSMLALPLAQSSWHGSEVAAVLAVAATAMLAGQRWAIAVVAIAELLLAPTLAVGAFSGGLELWPGRIIALVALAATVPGLLQLRRASAALVLVTGCRRTRVTCRRFHIALVILGVLAVVIPLL